MDEKQLLTAIFEELKNTNKRLDAIEDTQQKIMQAITEVDTRLQGVEAVVHDIKDRQDDTETDVKLLKRLAAQ